MLVLSRKVGERIQIGDRVVITIVKIQGASVRIGVDAPPETLVVREELADQATVSGERLGFKTTGTA